MRQYQSVLAEEGVRPPVNWKLYLVLVGAGLLLGKVVSLNQRGAVSTPELRLLGIVAAQIALFVLTFFNEKFVYFALIIYMPFSLVLPGDYGFAVNIANILIMIILFGLIVRSIKTGDTFFQKSSLDRLLLVWLAVLTVSFMRGAYLAERDWTILAVCLKRFLTPIMIYFITFWLIRDRAYLKDTVVVLLLGVAFATFLNIKDSYVPSEFRWESRWGEVASQGNQFAAFTVYSMFIYVGILWENGRKPLYWGLLVPFFWCLRSVMLSYSRGGWVAFAVASCFFCMLRNKVLGVIIIVLFIAIYNSPSTFLPNSVAQRIKGTTQVRVTRFEKTVVIEESAESRVVLWKGALKMIARNPIIGVGYTWSRRLINNYAPVPHGQDLHNGYLTIATEMGIPALIIFLIIIHHIFKATWLVYRHSPDPFTRAVAHGYLAGIVGFIVANMFGDRFSSEETVSYFWITAAVIMKIKTVLDSDMLAKRLGLRNNH